MHWNPAGTLVAIGSYDSILRVCTASGDLYFSHAQHQVFKCDDIFLRMPLTPKKGPIFAVRFSKDGRWLLTASLDSTVCLWDIPQKELHMQYRTHTGISSIFANEINYE
jgi:transducin (beta)-like 1